MVEATEALADAAEEGKCDDRVEAAITDKVPVIAGDADCVDKGLLSSNSFDNVCFKLVLPLEATDRAAVTAS
jgi:hypothetical protein